MKSILLTSLLLLTNVLNAQPSIVDTLELGHSIVMVTTDLPDGSNGRGSGVVVSPEYVATNCHVIANSKGVNIAKFRDGYQPIGLKANWKRDVCLLKFDPLPFKPIPMRDSQSLQYEEEVFSMSFPAGAPVPQLSYGAIKGIYPFDGSLIVRSNASFYMGSSGGALFDQHYNLIGLTTFKSPGQPAFYYSLPVEWIKELMAAPETTSLKTNDVPFWALPLEQRPYFMQVVIPYQNADWRDLKTIAGQWTGQEPASADAWYFLGLAEEGLQHYVQAEQDLKKAYDLNQRDVDAMLALSRVAFVQKDLATLESIQPAIQAIDPEQGEKVTQQIQALKQASP
ncbi:trypsin-like peptidase domain-containing protein [Methylophilus glucosoxydans]|uniref:Trypsin-like peptidase domain-containing protein n=1 Tax=Methylophilus glucosoxydans TaxID=752553 RepID=A0ABW3GKA0_9PROT|nr:trypsin-like peptidase domain-containing protein [Methylophilus sp. VKM B-3414]MDT7848815.1 trypsin-like peptidase domain-containing protein [Methylophilus sp. VKM B-3414]